MQEDAIEMCKLFHRPLFFKQTLMRPRICDMRWSNYILFLVDDWCIKVQTAQNIKWKHKRFWVASHEESCNVITTYENVGRKELFNEKSWNFSKSVTHKKKTIHKVIFYWEKPKKYPDLGHVLTKYDLKVVLLDF